MPMMRPSFFYCKPLHPSVAKRRKNYHHTGIDCLTAITSWCHIHVNQVNTHVIKLFMFCLSSNIPHSLYNYMKEGKNEQTLSLLLWYSQFVNWKRKSKISLVCFLIVMLKVLQVSLWFLVMTFKIVQVSVCFLVVTFTNVQVSLRFHLVHVIKIVKTFLLLSCDDLWSCPSFLVFPWNYF